MESEQTQLPLNTQYEDRFIEEFAGKSIYGDPIVAVIELIANAWDAGATRVDIRWPSQEPEQSFSISDNGHGMTSEEFGQRWMTLSYDRHRHQGEFAEFPTGVQLGQRRVYGRNGKGRLAGFCFAENYYVTTCKNGIANTYKVSRGMQGDPLVATPVGDDQVHRSNGTEIFVRGYRDVAVSVPTIRKEVGMRFLTDPNFVVYIDDEKVDFLDIPEDHIEQVSISVDSYDPVTLIVINQARSDSSTKLHGIAWQVNGRLVGQCCWDGISLDGRTIAAKRYTFIVQANALVDAVTPDWTQFDETKQSYKQLYPQVLEKINEYILETTEEERKASYKQLKDANKTHLKRMGLMDREVWSKFVKQVQTECPSINSKELLMVASILASLEASKSKYSLIQKLHSFSSEQLDNLNTIFDDWNIDAAKIVLDELKTRLSIIGELENKVYNPLTDELHDLQPLFKRALWIFGPEYETIEYTSNVGMTRVIQELFNDTVKGSRNRPDFAIMPDGTVGLYSYPEYDKAGGEIGIKRLAIVELKKPGVKVSTDQKAQCWKYVLELYKKGQLQDHLSEVKCFALGREVDAAEASVRTEKNGAVEIIPMTYTTVLERAKSRTHKLYEKIKNSAAFLADFDYEDDLEEYEQQKVV